MFRGGQVPFRLQNRRPESCHDGGLSVLLSRPAGCPFLPVALQLATLVLAEPGPPCRSSRRRGRRSRNGRGSHRPGGDLSRNRGRRGPLPGKPSGSDGPLPAPCQVHPETSPDKVPKVLEPVLVALLAPQAEVDEDLGAVGEDAPAYEDPFLEIGLFPERLVDGVERLRFDWDAGSWNRVRQSSIIGP